MYSFYFELKNQTKNTHDDIVKKISLHSLVCDSNICIFGPSGLENSSLQKLTLDDIELKITRFFKSFRFRTP